MASANNVWKSAEAAVSQASMAHDSCSQQRCDLWIAALHVKGSGQIAGELVPDEGQQHGKHKGPWRILADKTRYGSKLA